MSTATDRTIDERIAAIREREALATEGPWAAVSIMPAGENATQSWGESPWRNINGPPQAISDDMLCRRAFTHPPDPEFMAHARQDVPWLLEQLATLRAIVNAAAESHRLNEQWVAATNRDSREGQALFRAAVEAQQALAKLMRDFLATQEPVKPEAK